jgi:hypothetical protein
MDETPDPPPEPAIILEQYKAYIQDLGNFGTRYTTANGFYLSVVTALLGILALAKTGEAFGGAATYLGLAVSAFAVLVCLIWSRSVTSYRKLFGIKFDVLRAMEKAGRLFKIYKLEDDLRRDTSLLDIERFIPLLLSLPFFVTFVFFACRLLRQV